jgi:hypothetical protein
VFGQVSCVNRDAVQTYTAVRMTSFCAVCESVSKCFRTGHLVRELQMVQLSVAIL